MQSGERNTKKWCLDPELQNPKYVEPLMGWTGSADTIQQLRLTFSSKEEAIAYAKSKNYEFYVEEKNPRKQIKKSYADNFAYKPLE